MLTLDELLFSVTGPPIVAEILRDFSPPARFADRTFASYHPRHPTQQRAADRLAALAVELDSGARRPRLSRLLRRRREAGRGTYLDGGFGVGKTHLLAALWNASPSPRAYLSFDELMYLIGIVGAEGAIQALRGYLLIAIDEWELDDPGNLKMALAFLRGVLEDGAHVAVTSNTLPLELGAGRFSQKDFAAEIEELASAFEVLRIEGEDYRHRYFESRPGEEYFVDGSTLTARLESFGDSAVSCGFGELVQGLSRLHPIRYRQLARLPSGIGIYGLDRVDSLLTALRFVHFIDAVYDHGLPLIATGTRELADIFPADALAGPYGKKLSRCLSRLEELLGEAARQKAVAPPSSG